MSDASRCQIAIVDAGTVGFGIADRRGSRG